MRIRSLEIEHMRAITHLVLKDLPSNGVIVISGENERGKSTIMEAIKLVLGENHDTNKQSVKAIQPKGHDVGTRICLEADLGPVRFRVSKVFNKKKSCELTIFEPKPANYTGKEADSQLSGLLDAHLDHDLFSALFVEQGDITSMLSAAGISSVTQALGGATDYASNEDNALILTVEKEKDRYFTKSGATKKGGELGIAQTAVAEAEQAVLAATQQKETLDRRVESVAGFQRDRDQTQQDLPNARDTLTTREQELKTAELAAQQLENASAQLKIAQDQERILQADIDAREELRKEQSRLSEALQIRIQEELDLKDKADSLSEAREKLRSQHEKARAEAEKMRQRLEKLKESLRLGTLRTSYQELLTVSKQLEELRTVPEVTGAQLSAAEEANDRAKAAAYVVEAHAATMRINAAQPVTIQIDGEAVALNDTEWTTRITSELTAVIGDVSLTIEPGEQGEQLEQKRAETQETLHAALGDAKDIATLRLQREAWVDAEKELQSLNKRKNEIAMRFGDKADLERDIADAELQVAELDIQESDDLQQLIDDAEKEYLQYQQDADAYQKELGAWASNDIQVRYATVKARVEAERENLDRCDQKIKAQEEQRPLEALHSELHNVTAELKRQQDHLAELRETDNLQVAKDLYAGAAARVESLENTIRDCEANLKALQTQIDYAAGAAEQLDVALAQRDVALRTLEAVHHRAQAAMLLYTTLIRHRDIARQKYAAPFTQRLTEFAAPVFGKGVVFELGPDLSVVKRTMKEQTVGVDELSGGAQEQLSIVQRFAVADLASQGGETVPVFIDDALGSTDSNRLEMMATLFSRQGHNQQVFVLTCMPQRYDYVAGKHELRISDLMQ
ncbi:AAA family ATPase [Corynebacterium diphtheriae]